jgi:hypothetical protein
VDGLVLGAGANVKIVWIIVPLISTDMVNFLTAIKSSAKFFFGHPTVKIPFTIRENIVSIFVFKSFFVQTNGALTS